MPPVLLSGSCMLWPFGADPELDLSRDLFPTTFPIAFYPLAPEDFLFFDFSACQPLNFPPFTCPLT